MRKDKKTNIQGSIQKEIKVKKVLKIVGRILLGILAVIAAFLLFVKIWNEIAMSREKELLADHPGEFVEVDGHNMNIYVEGDGDHNGLE